MVFSYLNNVFILDTSMRLIINIVFTNIKHIIMFVNKNNNVTHALKKEAKRAYYNITMD